MKNKILRTIQKVFCAVMMVVVIIISTVFILIAPIAKRVIRQNIFAAILTGGDIYRNHDNDFDLYDGKRVIDIFLENTDPSLVTFELDAAWAWRAGVNAADFVREHAGRFELIHVKETSRVLTEDDKNLFKKMGPVRRAEDGSPLFTPEQKALLNEHQKINCKLGDGIINMPELKKAADAQGVKAYIVEREYAYTGDNYTTILADREYLSKL